jgi:hypothetical protein
MCLSMVRSAWRRGGGAGGWSVAMRGTSTRLWPGADGPVVPDCGGQGEEALRDPDEHAAEGASAVGFEVDDRGAAGGKVDCGALWCSGPLVGSTWLARTSAATLARSLRWVDNY